MPHNSKLEFEKPFRSSRKSGRVRTRSPSAPARRMRIYKPNGVEALMALADAGHRASWPPFSQSVGWFQGIALTGSQTEESEKVDPLASVLRSCIQSTTMPS